MGLNGFCWFWLALDGFRWVWMGVNEFRLVWMGLDGSGLVWMCLDGFKWRWFGLDGSGWVWMGLVGFGWVVIYESVSRRGGRGGEVSTSTLDPLASRFICLQISINCRTVGHIKLCNHR